MVAGSGSASRRGQIVAGSSEHGEHAFASGAFLGSERSDDLVQIQVCWAPGKTVDQKLAMYPTALATRAGSGEPT